MRKKPSKRTTNLLDLVSQFSKIKQKWGGIDNPITTPFSEMLSYCDDPYLAHRGSEKEHLRKERMK